MATKSYAITEFLIAARKTNRVASDAVLDMEKRTKDSQRMIVESRELITKTDELIERGRRIWHRH